MTKKFGKLFQLLKFLSLRLGFVLLCKTGNVKLPLGICSLIKIHDVVQLVEILHLYSLHLYHDSSDNSIV